MTRHSNPQLGDIDAATAAMFPKEWAAANAPGVRRPSEKRKRLRARYKYAVAFAAWRLANPDARCGSCLHCGTRPMSKDRICELDSDFHGYAITTADKVCMRWEGRA